MKNLLKIALLLVLILTQLSCERDEICLEDITPKLVIRFYNINKPNEIKSVIGLSVNIEGIDGEYTNETITSVTDSIAIPLKVDEANTRLILTIPVDNDQVIEDNTDTLSVIYSQQDIFISRSCGYKTVFNDTELSLINDNNNWIMGVDPKSVPLQITDENLAHVKIYH